MNPTVPKPAHAGRDVLVQYVSSVQDLSRKMRQILASKDEIAGSLSRAAAALRSMAAAGGRRRAVSGSAEI